MKEYCSDVVIHIDENLNDDDIHKLEHDIFDMHGVFSACVNEKARHLMLVDFDPMDISPGQLLANVRGHGLHAELIGL